MRWMWSSSWSTWALVWWKNLSSTDELHRACLIKLSKVRFVTFLSCLKEEAAVVLCTDTESLLVCFRCVCSKCALLIIRTHQLCSIDPIDHKISTIMSYVFIFFLIYSKSWSYKSFTFCRENMAFTQTTLLPSHAPNNVSFLLKQMYPVNWYCVALIWDLCGSLWQPFTFLPNSHDGWKLKTGQRKTRTPPSWNLSKQDFWSQPALNGAFKQQNMCLRFVVYFILFFLTVFAKNSQWVEVSNSTYMTRGRVLVRLGSIKCTTKKGFQLFF